MHKTAVAMLLSAAFAGAPSLAAEPESWVDGGARITGVSRTHYDGTSNDLLTAGLGAAGLQGAAPQPKDKLHPTANELRQLAIYTNYRGLVDVSEGGGYGLFWGPNVGADGKPTDGNGLIAGDEILAFADQPDGSRVTVMVQIPDTFDPKRACIVTAPSSGSRGVYGAIATAGEWGLKHGCAVAYTDKGTGTGFDDLQRGLVTSLHGEVTTIAAAGSGSQFTARLPPAQRASLGALVAFKHAHSQANPEANWGRYVLQSIRFAFRVLNEKYPGQINRRNTAVIASSVSNGGGASLRAAEQDTERLINAVVVAEPNVNPLPAAFAIQQGEGKPFREHAKRLIDTITLQNVFVGCAVAAPSAPTPNPAPSPDRCTALKAAGLLSAATVPEQAAEAQAILNRFGILPEQNGLQGLMWGVYVPQSIAVAYANAYGRFSVADALCGFGYGRPGSDEQEAVLFATGSGIPPTGGIPLLNMTMPSGPADDRGSTPDQDLRGALCLRSLATGRDAATGRPLPPAQAAQARRVAAGVGQILATGALGGRPVLIVTGRADDILPPNFASRAYVGLNLLQDGTSTKLRYIEVTNAQHLDGFLGVAELKRAYVPLQRYYVQAMDLMLAHLRSGQPLPPSQVVHTKPRGAEGDNVPALTADHVPAISNSPGANAITFANGVLRIPE